MADITPPAALNCPVDPDADYFLHLIAAQFDEIENRDKFLCLSYDQTPQGDRYNYRVALRAAHFIYIFVINAARMGSGGSGGSIVETDPNIVKSYKEGDIQITYRDNIAVNGSAASQDQYTNPYEKELMELEADLLGTNIGVNVIL